MFWCSVLLRLVLIFLANPLWINSDNVCKETPRVLSWIRRTHVISFKVCVMTCNKERALFLMWTYWDRSHTWTPGCPFISPHISVMSAVPLVGNFTKHEPRSENLSLLYYCIMFQISLSVSVHLQWVILLNVVTVKWLFQPISFPPGINSSIRSVRVCECDTGELGHS